MRTEQSRRADSPVLMVSIGTGAPSHSDERAQFSQNILRNIQGFSNLRMISAEAMRVGGQPGYEVKLEGNSLPDNTEVDDRAMDALSRRQLHPAGRSRAPRQME